jgi:hypothetical protein
MAQRLTRIAPWQAGKVLAFVYALLGVLVSLLSLAGYFLVPEEMADEELSAGGALAMAVALPFLYALAGLLIGPIVAWLYNLSARWTGGLELEFAGTDSDELTAIPGQAPRRENS